MRLTVLLIGIIVCGALQASPKLPDINLQKVSEALSMIKRDAFGDITLEDLRQYSRNGDTINVEKKFTSAVGIEHKLIISVNQFRAHIIYWAEVIEPGKDNSFFDVEADEIINQVKSLGIKVKDVKKLSGHRWEWEHKGFSCNIKASTVASTSKELWYECIYR